MADIPNPTDVDAVIVCDQNGNLVMIVPDEFEIGKGEDVRWAVEPDTDVELAFGFKNSPFSWDSKKNTGKAIEGTVRAGAKARSYKYTVTDANQNRIDPRLRIRG